MKIKLFLVAILLAAVFCVTSTAFAMTNSERQALIAQIQAQIAQLTQQLLRLQRQQQGAETWCHTFNIDLDIGSAGSEVSALQTALQKQGFTITSSELTSQTFSSATGQAAKDFKTKYKSQIVTAGTTKVAEKTRGILNQLYGCNQATPTPTPTPNPISVTPTPTPTPTPTTTPTPIPTPVAADTVQLHSVKIDGNNLKIKYSKNFDGCAYFTTENYQTIIQTANNFCQKGDNIEVIAPLSYFIITAGQRIKLCQINNSNICSELVAAGKIVAASCLDSDIMMQYAKFAKGTVSGVFSDGLSYSYTDSCSQSNIIEWYCDNNTPKADATYKCDWGCENGACKFNYPPTVTVGPDLTVNENSSITLQGIASDSDIGDRIVSYAWSCDSGIATISARNSAITMYTAPSVSRDTTFTCDLIVWDIVGQNGRDTLNILVKDIDSPSVKVLSPNGGEKLNLGQTYNIQWSSIGYNDNDLVLIVLTNEKGNYYGEIVRDYKNNGSYSWTPSSATIFHLSGYYKIQVYLKKIGSVNYAEVNDYSDNYFSIVAAP